MDDNSAPSAPSAAPPPLDDLDSYDFNLYEFGGHTDDDDDDTTTAVDTSSSINNTDIRAFQLMWRYLFHWKTLKELLPTLQCLSKLQSEDAEDNVESKLIVPNVDSMITDIERVINEYEDKVAASANVSSSSVEF